MQYATTMATAAEAFRYSGSLDNHGLTGIVKVTAVESMFIDHLAPKLPEFKVEYPGIQLELLGTDSNLSFSRREIDIAIRLAKPDTPHVFVHKLADIDFAVYGARKDFEADFAGELTNAQLAELDWISYDDELAHIPEARMG